MNDVAVPARVVLFTFDDKIAELQRMMVKLHGSRMDHEKAFRTALVAAAFSGEIDGKEKVHGSR